MTDAPPIQIRVATNGKMYRRLVSIYADPIVVVSDFDAGRPKDIDEIKKRVERQLREHPIDESRIKSALEYVEGQLRRLSLQIFEEDSRRDAPDDPDANSDTNIEIVREIDPWPEAVELNDVLNELLCTIQCYIHISEDAAVAAALWSALTHVYDRFDILPRLMVQSPTRGCGKTTFLDLLSCFVPRPLLFSNMTAAPLFRLITKYRPTLFLDECDRWARRDDDLLSILNSGHRRDSAWVARCNPVTLEVECFSTWCPMALAGIGRLSNTLEDRSILILLHKKPPDVSLRRLNSRAKDEARQVGRKLARWAADYSNQITPETEPPDLPALSSDRAIDNWIPLFTLADMAGPQWGWRARQVAVSLDAEFSADDRLEFPIRLLRAIGQILQDFTDDFIPTQTLLDQLHSLEDHSLLTRHGKPISPRTLAMQLAQFGVRPQKTKKCNGYCVYELRNVVRTYATNFLGGGFDPPQPPPESQTLVGQGVTGGGSTKNNPASILHHPPPSSTDRPTVEDDKAILHSNLHPVSPDFTSTYDTGGGCGGLSGGSPGIFTDRSLTGLRQWGEQHNWPALLDPWTGEELFPAGPEAWHAYLNYVERQSDDRQQKMLSDVWSIIAEQKQTSSNE